MDPEQAERIASALETIASRLSSIDRTLAILGSIDASLSNVADELNSSGTTLGHIERALATGLR